MRGYVKAWQFVLGLSVAMVFAVVATGAAMIPGSDGVIHGCYKTTKSNMGALRVIDLDKGQKCASGEVAIAWNQTGPQGPQGLPGTDGTAGATGPAGPPGADGQDAVAPTTNPHINTARVSSSTTCYSNCSGAPDPNGWHRLPLSDADPTLKALSVTTAGPALLDIRLSATSECHAGFWGWCWLRFVVDGNPLQPSLFDTSQGTYAGPTPQAASYEQVLRVPSGTHTVAVEIQVAPIEVTGVDTSWTFSIETPTLILQPYPTT